jgi:hypothetical protein
MMRALESSPRPFRRSLAILPRLRFAAAALGLAAAALGLGACDLHFGSRPIGGGHWEGTSTTVEAPAAAVWEVVSAQLERLDARKPVPFPEGARSAVRVTWRGRWVKLAVDPARPHRSVLSAYAMNDLATGQELVTELVAALRQAGFEVQNPHLRSVEEVRAQRARFEGPFRNGRFGDGGAHDDHGHDDHGHDHDHGTDPAAGH